MKTTILMVDDEPDVVELVAFNLDAAGYAVIKAENGGEAIEKARREMPALIILDLMLPGIDGFDVCKVLRADPTTTAIPLIMLTARVAELDRVLGLALGADDYVTKPFSPRELVLRVKNVLRRRTVVYQGEQVQSGILTMDISRHEVRVREKPVGLTLTEFRLLECLMRRQGRVQSRQQLLRDVWQYDGSLTTRTVDAHVRRLRDKLGVAAKYVKTVRRLGYRFVES